MNLGNRILKTLLKPVPRSWMRSLGKPLGFLWWDVFGFRKKVVLENLTKAFPDWSEEQKKRVGRKSVYMLMENFFEFFLIDHHIARTFLECLCSKLIGIKAIAPQSKKD